MDLRLNAAPFDTNKSFGFDRFYKVAKPFELLAIVACIQCFVKGWASTFDPFLDR